MLDRDKVKDGLMRFVVAYGAPEHIKDEAHIGKVVDIYTTELAKHFNNHTIDKAITLAWTKARKFPTVSDFFEGYGGKEIKANGEINSIDDLKKMGYTFDD